MSITMKYYGRPASEQAVSGATAATTVYYLCSLQIVLPLQWFGRSRSLELITVDFCREHKRWQEQQRRAEGVQQERKVGR